jgi:hypothetical protein
MRKKNDSVNRLLTFTRHNKKAGGMVPPANSRGERMQTKHLLPLLIVIVIVKIKIKIRKR